MNTRTAWKIFATILSLFVLGLFLSSPAANLASPGEQTPFADGEFFASEPVSPAVSRPLREVITPPEPQLMREINPRHNPLQFEPDMGRRGTWNRTNIPLDPLIGRSLNGNQRTPSPSLSFEGLGNAASVTPPDVVGEVGPNHYVQMVNVQFAVYDKSGNILAGPTAFNALFNGAGGVCEVENAGDPIPVYDEMADRWFLSQFANPTHLCIAISQTADPTGSYYLYEFNVGEFPDYFKVGAWPDAYYISANENSGYTAYAFDRAKMLAGQAATFQKQTGLTNLLLPSDVDGPTQPPANTPGYFYTFKDDTYHGGGVDRIELYTFDVDWNTPANSTFTEIIELPIASFTYTACGFFNFNCIQQPGTTQRFDALGEWPMFSFRYRNFGTHEALVGVFGVGGGLGEQGAALRWFELRKPAATWSLHQEGTLDPGDGHDRFNPSIAMDKEGNIALGYSVGSSTLFPDIRYTIHEAGDPAGSMQNEVILKTGGGSQTGSPRWGDYSAMSLDPSDDCTFWYTNMYYETSSSANWKTYIGAFTIPSCVASGPSFTLDTTPASQAICAGETANFSVDVGSVNGFGDSVTLSLSGQPGGSTVGFTPNPVTPPNTASLSVGTTGSTPANSYSLVVSGASVTETKTNTVTLSVVNSTPSAVSLISPASGALNQPLQPTFSWDSVAGADDYLLEIASDANFTTVVYSATVTGESHQISQDLNPATSYFWRVTAQNVCGVGAASAERQFTTASSSLVCNGEAIGFEDGLPTDWTVTDNSPGSDGIVWTTTASAECGFSNLTNGSGEAACADSDAAGEFGPPYNTALVSPPLDFSQATTINLAVAAAYRDFGAGNDLFSVEVWNGSAWDEVLLWDETFEPGDINLNLDAYAGQADSQIRFIYQGDGWDWYAQVDDVALDCAVTVPEPDLGLSLSKTVGLDPAQCATETSLNLTEASDVTYCYTAENTGDTALTSHSLNDDQLGPIFSGWSYNLEPGASLWVTETTTVNASVVNVAQWLASANGATITATAQATVTVLPPPALALDYASSPPQAARPNETVTHTLTLTNLSTVSEDYGLSLSSTWPATLSLGTLNLPASTSNAIWLTVGIPATATLEDTGRSTITVRSLTTPTLSVAVPFTTTVAPLPGQVFTLTTFTEGEGVILVEPPALVTPTGSSLSFSQRVYSAGTAITLTATAAPGWAFVGWGGNLSGEANPTQVIMNNSRTVTATFLAVPTPTEYLIYLPLVLK